MLGGTVIGLCRRASATLLTVYDPKTHEERAVRVVETRLDTNAAVALALGDRVWWQAKTVLWTPSGVKATGQRMVNGMARYDIPLALAGRPH